MVSHSDQGNEGSPTVRAYQPDEVSAVAQIYFDSVQIGTANYYDAEQRMAWAGEAPDPEAWDKRLQSKFTLVAERHARLIGFMTLETTGHIAFAFVAPDVIGQGVAKALFKAIEREARALDLPLLTTDASHMARAFFERQDWTIVRQQSVSRNGVTLTNFRMTKSLIRGVSS